MPILGKNAFDNAGRCIELSQGTCRWIGNLIVTGTITSDGGGEVLANNVYQQSDNAAGTGTIGLIKGDTTDNTFINAITGKVIKFGINSVSLMTFSGTVLAPVTTGLIDLGTSALRFGDVYLEAGKTLHLEAGADGKAGTVTLNGVTPVAVGNTSITANSIVIFTLKTVGGTVGAYPAIQTITPTTGFTVAGTALDTSVYNYAVLEIA